MDFRRKFEFGLAWRTIAAHRRDPARRQGGRHAGRPRRTDRRRRSSGSSRWRACGISSGARTSSSRASSNRVRFEDYSQRFSDPERRRLRRARADPRPGIEDAPGAPHRRKAPKRATSSAIVDDAPSALLTIDRDGRVQILNKAARQLFARQPLNRLDGSRSARARARRGGSASAWHAQDHAADPRRRAAEGDLRLGPGRAARPAGHRALDPAGAKRARRARSRGAGRSGARADPRDHEFADSGNLARAHRRRPGRDGGEGRRRTCRRKDRDGDRRAPGRRHPPLRRKLSRVRPGARQSTAASSRPSPGPRRSCGSRSPMRPTAKSMRGSRSSRRP